MEYMVVVFSLVHHQINKWYTIKYLSRCPSVKNYKKNYFEFNCYSITLINIVFFSTCTNCSHEFNL